MIYSCECFLDIQCEFSGVLPSVPSHEDRSLTESQRTIRSKKHINENNNMTELEMKERTSRLPGLTRIGV